MITIELVVVEKCEVDIEEFFYISSSRILYIRLLEIVLMDGCSISLSLMAHFTSSYHSSSCPPDLLSILYLVFSSGCLGGRALGHLTGLCSGLQDTVFVTQIDGKANVHQLLGKHLYVSGRFRGGGRVAKQKTLPTYSSVAIGYRNNFMIDRTLRQTHGAPLLFIIPLSRCCLQCILA